MNRRRSQRPLKADIRLIPEFAGVGQSTKEICALISCIYLGTGISPLCLFVYLRGAPSRPPLSLAWTSKRRAIASRRTVHGANRVLLCPPARTN